MGIKCVLIKKGLVLLVIDAIARACPHFKNGDKNEINRSQTRKIAQIISRY